MRGGEYTYNEQQHYQGSPDQQYEEEYVDQDGITKRLVGSREARKKAA